MPALITAANTMRRSVRCPDSVQQTNNARWRVHLCMLEPPRCSSQCPSASEAPCPHPRLPPLPCVTDHWRMRGGIGGEAGCDPGWARPCMHRTRKAMRRCGDAAMPESHLCNRAKGHCDGVDAAYRHGWCCQARDQMSRYWMDDDDTSMIACSADDAAAFVGVTLAKLLSQC